jgi:hypothetical protein
MENMDKKECGACGGGCCGGMHMHGCHDRKRHLLKMILKIVIIVLIFWCGFQLGQMTGFIKAEYGRGIMMRGYGNNLNNNTVPAPLP